jgi:membrane-associated phospholipid phosphatase
MAMPSMHITVVALYAMFFWREGGWRRWGSIAFAVLIFLGSLYSGWHYAIDGYVGVSLAALCMWLTRGTFHSASRPSWTGKIN